MSLSELSDKELVNIAQPIMDNLMDGSTEKDWERHTRDFTDGARASLSEEELLRQCDAYQSKYGNFGSRELMGLTRHPDYVGVYWKQRMTKTDAEYLAVLSLVEVSDTVKVIRCYVDLWEPKNQNR